MMAISGANANTKIQKNNWPLLVFFAALFVVMRGVQETNIVSAMWGTCASCSALHTYGGLFMFVISVTAGSNVVSNVPLVLMLVPEVQSYAPEDQRLAWVLLLWVSSVAGNLTLVGSVANLVTAERAKECSKNAFNLEFFEYLKFGVPSTLVVLLVGTACTTLSTSHFPRFSPVPPPPPAAILPPHLVLACGRSSSGSAVGIESYTQDISHAKYEPVVHGGAMLTPTPGDRPGLFFIGLSLSRNYNSSATPVETAFPTSITRQTQFDFNRIQDRDYTHVRDTNDDGWLTGGGEGGASNKLPNADSAHIELLHIGTQDKERGGMTLSEVDELLSSMKFDPIRLKPSYATLNTDSPPEFELRFARDENPTMVAVQSSLTSRFHNRLRELPDHFHMSIARKVRFRSSSNKKAFLDKGHGEVVRWRKQYPQGTVLIPEAHTEEVKQQEIDQPGGIYLFGNRNEILKYYPPVRATGTRSKA